MNSGIFSSADKGVLTLDASRQMLHISKRKYADLLKKGYCLATRLGEEHAVPHTLVGLKCYSSY